MTTLYPKSGKKTSIGAVEIREGLDGLTASRIITLYRRAPLFRDVRQPKRVWAMFEQSSLVLTAWYDGNLVGIARVLTDGTLFSYLCDLAVEPDVQRLGIGKQLLNTVFEKCKGTELILRDSKISASYYAHIGFTKVENSWVKQL